MEIPYFAALKAKLDQLTTRQRVVAENIANAYTPGYTPRDVRNPDFSALLKGGDTGGGVRLAITQSGHLGGQGGVVRWRVGDAPDSETTLDGNRVVLEEQTLKAAEVRMQYDLAVGLYEKGMDLLRSAARSPTR
jgi:flagellar basal-body rod protein FlgB